MHQEFGPKIELTSNPQWGEHFRKEAPSHATLVDRHLSDGRVWILGGAATTFADITLCTAITFSKFPANATPLDDRFACLVLRGIINASEYSITLTLADYSRLFDYRHLDTSLIALTRCATVVPIRHATCSGRRLSTGRAMIEWSDDYVRRSDGNRYDSDYS